jgi:hypothetical protein
VRIWDLPPHILCRHHLIGEHRELHALWTILTEKKEGYSNHPETKRWNGKLRALYARHEALVKEMEKRGYTHSSHLEKRLAGGEGLQNDYVHTPQEQVKLLKVKGCACLIEAFQG